MSKVLVIGSTCVDVILKLDHLPVTGEDLHPKSQSFALGGCAFNTAEILRQAEADFALICPVGGGVYGEFVRRGLVQRGYRDFIDAGPEENGCCYCLVEKGGERTFLSCHGVEYRFQKEWMDPWKDAGFQMAYVCGLEVEEPTGEQLVEYLEENREMEVWFAPGPRGVEIPRGRLERMLALKPALHINEPEACALARYLKKTPLSWKESAGIIHQKTDNAVIVTLGERGAYCVKKNGESFQAPGYPVDVADTIGAGDAHIGAVLAGLSKGWTLEQSVDCGNRAAAAVVGKEGAGLPEERIGEINVFSESTFH